MPKAVVINPFFDWGVDRPPRREYADTVIYEAHVKGLTGMTADLPEASRGTYSAIADPVVIDHRKIVGHHSDRADARAPISPTTPH